jgi:acyl transferase domain-containing protein
MDVTLNSLPNPDATIARTLAALKEARTRIETLEKSHQDLIKAQNQIKSEPIAIIGMACRFPGRANSPDQFWDLMDKGQDAISEFPDGRWDVNAYYDANPDAVGKIYTRKGGFLTQVDTFDAQFFGISPREAMSLDPQHRLLLEVSWEALEDACQSPDQLIGSRTGVFVGIGQNDYEKYRLFGPDPSQIDSYDATGSGFCFASGRLSYFYDFQGPSMSIDTACSSSLVALHQACKSLLAGECDLALAGGVQIMLKPESGIYLSRIKVLSPDGRCKTFDASADGYGRGEGCGVIALRRLSEASARGDRILAVIRGSAVNHDGSSSSFTAPNGQAQQALLRQAFQNADVDPASVDYVEAHGTGTPLGDPIEVNALAAVLGPGRSADRPLWIGSVKTNINHLEAASGIAGIIKVVLALQHNRIPAHLLFNTPSPHIPWDRLPVQIIASAVPWLASSHHPRRAGVSAFGISGTNAHIIIEEAPGVENNTMVGVQTPPPTGSRGDRPVAHICHVLTLSARTPQALTDLVQRYRDHLAQHSDLSLSDMGAFKGSGRG